MVAPQTEYDERKVAKFKQVLHRLLLTRAHPRTQPNWLDHGKDKLAAKRVTELNAP